MPSIPGTIQLTSPISPQTTENNYYVTDPQYGLGGLRTVGTTAELEAIYDLRRQKGMIVYVEGASAYYALIGTTFNAGWTTGFTFGSGGGGGGGIVGDYVVSFNGNTGAVSGASLGANIFVGLNSFYAGISASGISANTIVTSAGITVAGVAVFNSGVTLNGRLDVIGDAEFDGNVTLGNASTDNINATGTFQGITVSARPGIFNSGISVAAVGSTFGGTVLVSGGATLSGRVDVGGILDVVGGATFESSLDVTGLAVFGTRGGVTYPFSNLAAGTCLGQGISFAVLSNAAFNGNVLIGPSGGVISGTTLGVVYVRSGTTFERDVNFSAAVRATTFTGNLTGNVTGNADTATNATNATNAINASNFGGLSHTAYAKLGSANTFTDALNTFNNDVSIGKTLTVGGNFYVTGTVTTVNRTELAVDDIKVSLGTTTGSMTDVLADGGGIVLKGTTDKTFTWVNSTDAWTSNQHIDLSNNQWAYKIAGITALEGTTLGAAVVSSSLTRVGTINTGVWEGTVVGITYGGTGRNLGGGTNWGLIYKSSDNTLQITSAGTVNDVLQGNASGAPTWVNRSTLTGLTADKVRLTGETGINVNVPLVYASTVISIGDRVEGLRHDTGLYYNPLFQTLFAEKIEGTIDGGTW